MSEASGDPTDASPFAALGLPVSFDLRDTDIERAYLTRAARLHPDIARGGDAGDEAARRMAVVNDARATLRDPERRASAVLAALGGPSASNDNALPDGFLMEIMQTRMAVEEAAESEDPEALAEWVEWAEIERQRAIDEVGAMFNALTDPPANDVLADIRKRLNAWRYIERLVEQLDQPGTKTGSG